MTLSETFRVNVRKKCGRTVSLCRGRLRDLCMRVVDYYAGDDGGCGADACAAVGAWCVVEVGDCYIVWPDCVAGCRSGTVGP